MFAVQGLHIRCYDRILRWYEYGTGVSTNEKARARMDADWRAMLTLMRELYPQDRHGPPGVGVLPTTTATSPACCAGLIGRLVVPQNCAFKKAQRSWQPPDQRRPGRAEENLRLRRGGHTRMTTFRQRREEALLRRVRAVDWARLKVVLCRHGAVHAAGPRLCVVQPVPQP